MALDYLKVLRSLKCAVTVIGRGEASAHKFSLQGEHPVIRGGLESFLKSGANLPYAAIVAVGVEELASTTLQLLKAGVRKILVEKPGALNRTQIEAVNNEAEAQCAHVVVAYNRRFYASTLTAQKMIQEDGGVLSVNFEFTEWAHKIESLKKAPGVKEGWLIGNSTHVIDLAFYLGGNPVEMQNFTAGTLEWHPNASIFSGAGRTNRGALFSYNANWAAPGRWAVEVMTYQRRLIFRPLETLQAMRRGSATPETVSIDDSLDKKFKPGIYEQTRSFLDGLTEGMCLLPHQVTNWHFYEKIAGYNNI